MEIHATSWVMIFVFILGYFLITIEHITHINKATIALMMAVACWVLQFGNETVLSEENLSFLGHHLANISQVVFFLLGALTIVEIINVHHGFDMISQILRVQSKRKVLWVFGALAFVLSAILDNLTTTVVMITLLREMVKEGEDRLLIGGGVVVAANAGGAWTPIGDVTTTMLWIGGEISTLNIMKILLLPSIICMIVAIGCLSWMLSGKFQAKKLNAKEKSEPIGRFIFYLGIGSLVFVPIFKILTGLPPFMGMLFGLSVMWLITDIIHYREDSQNHLRVPSVLTRIDLSGVLFFLGILLAINALETAGLLEMLAKYLDTTIGNTSMIAALIGLASAVVDNVPLVAATMGMYDMSQYPVDHSLWQLIAYCAGTGGSILLIGSAAGVVFMGMEKVDFVWYIKRISIPALLGYFAGMVIYLIECSFC